MNGSCILITLTGATALVHTVLCRNAAASVASVLVSTEIPQMTLSPDGDVSWASCSGNAEMLCVLDRTICFHKFAHCPRACFQLLLLCSCGSLSLAASDASCVFSIHGDRRGSGNASSIESASATCIGREAVQLQVAQSLIPYISNFTGQPAQSLS